MLQTNGFLEIRIRGITAWCRQIVGSIRREHGKKAAQKQGGLANPNRYNVTSLGRRDGHLAPVLHITMATAVLASNHHGKGRVRVTKVRPANTSRRARNTCIARKPFVCCGIETRQHARRPNAPRVAPLYTSGDEGCFLSLPTSLHDVHAISVQVEIVP